ncbi:MAG: radical SAM family heme chaperone HemW [Magnetovibrio sp.]|nr:radical SAM family heme chaperone HemW [Magnetovibrio sp.]
MADTAAPEPGAELALYVHWPFCERKCPYCDFNSHETGAVDHRAWLDALLAEIDHYALETAGRRLTSIFFGGGTPSLMDPDTVGAVIARAAAHWPAAPDLEVTLEANPSSAERGRFRAYRDAGVNRLSVGVQSLDDAALRFLGRLHDAEAARAALAAAAAEFERFSFDLIYALPDQTPAAWRAELAEALTLAGEHLSVYQLTIEPGTAFFRDGVEAAPEDPAAEMYEVTQQVLGGAGLAAYEVSNHARPGAESRHNLTYWRGGDYVGVGPGAHGRLTLAGRHWATHQIHDPARWLETAAARGEATAKRRELTGLDRAEELVMTGLRLTNGLAAARLQRLTGAGLLELADGARLAELVDGGFLDWDGVTLRATPAGRLRLNAVLARLLAPELSE